MIEDDSSRVSINDIQEEVRRVVVGLTGVSWETKTKFYTAQARVSFCVTEKFKLVPMPEK